MPHSQFTRSTLEPRSTWLPTRQGGIPSGCFRGIYFVISSCDWMISRHFIGYTRPPRACSNTFKKTAVSSSQLSKHLFLIQDEKRDTVPWFNSASEPMFTSGDGLKSRTMRRTRCPSPFRMSTFKFRNPSAVTTSSSASLLRRRGMK